MIPRNQQRNPQPTQPLDRFYANVSPPRRMVLLGKGPSLERYRDEDYRDWIVWGINETMAHYRCDIGCYVDKHHCLLLPFDKNPDLILLRPKTCSGHHDRKGYTIDFSNLWPVSSPFYNVTRSTAALSIFIAATWGVHEILCVGFDSMDYDQTDVKPGAQIYAKTITAIKDRANNNYGTINDCIRIAMAYEYLHPLRCRWWHRGDDGKKPLPPPRYEYDEHDERPEPRAACVA